MRYTLAIIKYSLFTIAVINCTRMPGEADSPDACQVAQESSCAAGVTYLQSNFSSIKVYVDGTLSFEQTVGNNKLYSNCHGDNLAFDSNINSISGINLIKASGQYCKIQVNFLSTTIKPITGSINGSLSDFTEIIAGSYKFVPVRGGQ